MNLLLLFLAASGAVLMLLVLMPLYLYLDNKNTAGSKPHSGGAKALALAVKGFATFIAFVFCLTGTLGCLGLLKQQPVSGLSYSYFLAAGLFLCMTADVILGIHFIAGMGVFWLGHLCYIAFFLSLARPHWSSIPLFLVLLVPLYLYLSPYLKKQKDGSLPYYLYGITILATLSIALPLPFTAQGSLGLFPALGTFLFVLSDILLVRNIMIKSTLFSNAVSLGFYYASQFILAMSVFLPGLARL